tara:strand:+ start:1010 stop:1285 length:276 start_codon:yes stop_codon:yes gene_type:complete
MGKLKDWAIGEGIEMVDINERTTNRYIVELSIPTIETYEIESDTPLTRSEIISRVQNKNPKFLDYGNEDHEIVAMEGKLEEEMETKGKINE